MKRALFLASLVAIAACAPQPPKLLTLDEMKSICEDERREASGVQGKASVGVNSRTGLGLGLSLSLNDKFIRGIDPQVVYDGCIDRLSKQNAVS